MEPLICGLIHASLKGRHATCDRRLSCPLVIALALAILFFLLGGLALVRGRRGIRVDDHPHCTGCKFDLFGLADASVCPECGVSLQSPAARTIGTFRASPRWIVSGSILLAMALLAFAGWNFSLVGGIDWYAKMPLWLLERRSLSKPRSPAAFAARDEILRRARDGIIPAPRLGDFVTSILEPAKASNRFQQQVTSFLALPALPQASLQTGRKWALNVHADRLLPMHQDVALLLDTEFYSGRLSAREMEEFLRSAVRPRLVLLGPATCSPGEKLTLLIQWNWRGGWISPSVSFDVPGVSWPPDPWNSTGISDSYVSLRSRSGKLGRGELTASMAPGTHEIAGTVTIALTGRGFTANASFDPKAAAYPGGVANIPPIVIQLPISATYTVDPTLPASPADLARREIMRTISIESLGDQAPYLAGMSKHYLSVRYLSSRYSADAELHWTDGSTFTPCGHLTIEAEKDATTLWVRSTEGDDARGGPVQGALEVPIPGYGGIPFPPRSVLSKIRTLRARFTNIRIPRTPQTPIEPFDLEFPVGPIR